MAIRVAPPRPKKKARDDEKAPGGKSRSRCGSRLDKPATVIHTTVPSTTTHIPTESRATARVSRYSKNVIRRQIAMAMPFSCHQLMVDERNFAYWANPMAPDAIESGARKMVCQMNRKLIS